MNLAESITNTCHQSYVRAETKLGPGTMRFTETVEAKGIEGGEKSFTQRAATVESYFIMWRLTKDSKYRDWGWEVVEALEEHARTEAGYAGIKDVYQVEQILIQNTYSNFLSISENIYIISIFRFQQKNILFSNLIS